MRKAKSLLKETTPFQICSAPFLNSPEWDLFQNRSREKLWSCCSGERMFSVSYQQDLTKALFIICLFMQRVLQVPCNGRPSLLSRLAKKAIGRKHTTFTSCKHAACSNELFSLSSRLCFGGKRFDWANVNFGRLLNIFHTERSWHAHWFSLVDMICPLQEHFLSWPL